MRRPKASILIEIYDLIKMTFKSFRRQRMLPAFSIVLVIILIAIFFTFLSFVQTISPFVYPLF